MDPVRFSRLRLMARSPAHYKAGYQPSTEAMQIGTAAHERILMGTFGVTYDGVRRGKEWEAFKADQPAGVMIFNAREAMQVASMATSVQANSDAMRVLEGERETMRLWTKDGRACQGTPDVVSDTFVTELKTGETSDPRKFHHKVRDYAYHAQLAWYDAAVGVRKEHYIVAVESKAPFVTTVFKLSFPTILAGQKLCRLWWERLLQCEASNEWPGYCQSVVDLDMGDEDEVVTDGECDDEEFIK